MRLLFFGTDRFSLACLRSLLSAGRESEAAVLAAASGASHAAAGTDPFSAPAAPLCSRIEVMANPHRGGGRGGKVLKSPVRAFAEDAGLPLLDAPKAKSVFVPADAWSVSPEEIRARFDLGVVVSFGYFLPRELIEAFPQGAVNVHPSLLPRFRGAAPVQHCIMKGDAETGVTVQRLDPECFDAGDILGEQRRTPVLREDNYTSLLDRLAALGAEELTRVVSGIRDGSVRQTPQDPDGVTKAPKISDRHRRLDLRKLTALDAERRVRALNESGGTHMHWCGGKRVKVVSARALPESARAQEATAGMRPGEARRVGKAQVLVCCADETLLELIRVQKEGAREQDAAAFANGNMQQAAADGTGYFFTAEPADAADAAA